MSLNKRPLPPMTFSVIAKSLTDASAAFKLCGLDISNETRKKVESKLLPTMENCQCYMESHKAKIVMLTNLLGGDGDDASIKKDINELVSSFPEVRKEYVNNLVFSYS